MPSVKVIDSNLRSSEQINTTVAVENQETSRFERLFYIICRLMEHTQPGYEHMHAFNRSFCLSIVRCFSILSLIRWHSISSAATHIDLFERRKKRNDLGNLLSMLKMYRE